MGTSLHSYVDVEAGIQLASSVAYPCAGIRVVVEDHAYMVAWHKDDDGDDQGVVHVAVGVPWG